MMGIFYNVIIFKNFQEFSLKYKFHHVDSQVVKTGTTIDLSPVI